MELFYNQIAGEYISHIYTRGQGYGAQTEPSQGKNATNLLYDAIKFKNSLQGSQNQSMSGKKLSMVKLDPLSAPQRAQSIGAFENRASLQSVKRILKVQNSHIRQKSFLERSQSTNLTPIKFEESPRILIQNSQNGNGDYIRLVHLNPLKLANAKMLSQATPLKMRDSGFTNRESPVQTNTLQEKIYSFKVQSVRSQSVENMRPLKENQNVGYKPQVRKRVKAYRKSMLDSLKNQGSVTDRIFDLKDQLPLSQPSLCSVNQEASTLLSLSNRASSCMKPRKSVLVQRTNNEKQKKRVSICLNHEDAEERKISPHLINSNRLFRQLSDSKDNEEADNKEINASQPETTLTNLKMNSESDLVSIKLKRRRRSSNPIFDEDMLAELAENYDQENLNEDSNKNNARSFILGKKFRRNMIRCLNKMKALKLTPKEIMENQNIFSNHPFEKPFSEDLIKAVKFNNIKKVKLLLFQNTKYLVYDFDQVHQTALHWAAKKDFADIAQLLIEYGADVDAKDIAGRTPLYMAIENDSISALKILLANHANPWSTEDINYKELCKGHDLGISLLTKARQLTIIMNMTPPSLRHSVWQTKGMAMILGSQFSAKEKSMKEMIDINDLQ